jgi:ribonuclease J
MEFNLNNHLLSIQPLGGVEEIGSNMTLLTTSNEQILIDCGMLFPYEDCFDINYLIPDFKHLDASQLSSIIITHGHEDHIGGLVHLLKEFPNITVYATPFCLQLIQRKLEEHKINMNFQIYHHDTILRFKSIEIHPVNVNHSIPETHGLVIRTNCMTWGALYISDFKVDLTSTHEPPINLPKIQNLLSACKKTSFFLDSTNILHAGKTPSENELEPQLSLHMNSNYERIFITLFASNIHRLMFIIEQAKNSGRKIVILGRSIKTYLESAYESGISPIDPSQLLYADDAKNLSGKILVLLSGCQGDFLSALRRFSYGEDSKFKPQKGDLVVFSSKVIPGNEKKISRILNKLTDFGVEIITARDSFIHASGHPGQEDLKILLHSFRPDYYYPIHGESYFLKRHVDFIRTHYPEIETRMIHNFDEVNFHQTGIKITQNPKLEPKLIHGNSLEIERTQISQRRKMATQGAVFITVTRSQQKMNLSFLGLPLYAEQIKPQLETKLLEQFTKEFNKRDESYLRDQIKISIRQFFNQFIGYKPVVEVHLI